MSEHQVRRLTARDLPALLALQRQVLPDTMSARLGSRFNEVYHATMLASSDYLCDGYFVDGQLVGYLSYTADTMRLLRGVFQKNVFKYASAFIVDLIREPRILGLILRVGRSVMSPKGAVGHGPRITSELLSLGVLPSFRGVRATSGGKRSAADALLNNALTTLRARGVATLHIVVKPALADPVPHRFFRKYGFTGASRVERFGIDAELYELKLDQRQ